MSLTLPQFRAYLKFGYKELERKESQVIQRIGFPDDDEGASRDDTDSFNRALQRLKERTGLDKVPFEDVMTEMYRGK